METYKEETSGVGEFWLIGSMEPLLKMGQDDQTPKMG